MHVKMQFNSKNGIIIAAHQPNTHTVNLRNVSLAAILLLFNSCASILNTRDMKVRVTSTQPCYLVNHHEFRGVDTGDGFYQYNSGHRFLLTPDKDVVLTVERQRERLPLVIHSDAGDNTVYLRSRNSWVYWLNFTSYMCLGFLIDCTNEKRFAYPNNIVVAPENMADGRTYVYKKSMEAMPVAYTKGKRVSEQPAAAPVEYPERTPSVSYEKEKKRKADSTSEAQDEGHKVRYLKRKR